ncbi:MAG: thymidine phosphorylase [Candidatus Thermoplasmatota archaeon]|nr:thymidine phosphorylase [Candidatus Thermoplasmatota archaeon]
MTVQIRCERVDISTGGQKIAFFPERTARDLDIHPMDRVEMINVKDSSSIHTSTVQFWSCLKDRVGLCRELADDMDIRDEGIIVVRPIPKPGSVNHIVDRMNGSELSGDRIMEIVGDIVDDSLSEVEMSCFVTACTMEDLSMAELYNLTRYLAESGDRLEWEDEIVADKHCTGGVPGNRTSPIVVPIIAALGVKVPKASSRAITSPAGTADVMETMARVSFEKWQIQDIVNRTGACLIWGGGLNIAPADSKLIKIRKTIDSNPEGLLISSILSKKFAMGSKYVLIDMPVGLETRYKSLGEVRHMAQKLKKIAGRLGMRSEVEITFGDEPIGNGIGPNLEARDVLQVLMNQPNAPGDLRDKALRLAGKLIDLFARDMYGGDHRPGDGEEMAREVLFSGKALSKFREIISAQGGDPDITPDELMLSPTTIDMRAHKEGVLIDYDNVVLKKVARLAGAPVNVGSGIDLYKKSGTRVSRGELVLNVHCGSEEKQAMVYDFLSRNNMFTIE